MLTKQLSTLTLLLTLIWASQSIATDNFKTIENTLSHKRVAYVAPSPDGKQVAYVTYEIKSEKSGRKNWLYSLNVKKANGKIVELTKGDRIASVSWIGDSGRVSYLAKGDKFQSIWIADSKQGNANKYYEHSANIEAFKWSPSQEIIAFTAAIVPEKPKFPTPLDVSKDQVALPLYLLDAKKAVKQLTLNEINVTAGFDWSPNSETIVFAYPPKPGDEYTEKKKIGLIDLKTGLVKDIPYTANHNASQPMYSPDGKWIAFQANPSTEEIKAKSKYVKAKDPIPLLRISTLVSNICVSEMMTLETHCLASTPNESSTLLGWNAVGDNVFVLDTDKSTGYQIYALNLNQTVPATEISKVDGFIEPLTITLNNSRTMFGFGYEAVHQAPQAVISAVSPFTLEHISQHDAGRDLGKTEVITWKSKDGMNIEGLLITPMNYDSAKKYPMLVTVHGGPPGAWGKRYLGGCDEYDEMIDPTTCWSTLLDLGFVIFAPNPRGSDGYGTQFRLAILSDIGGMDYQDVITGIDYLIQKGVADPDHLAIAGWSYGGYLTTWAISHSNQFKAAVEGVGNTDWVSYAGTSGLFSFAPSYFQNFFWENDKLYHERSSILYVKNIETPLLIIHGELDRRVPITQSEELYQALHLQHKPVKMLVLHEQDHVPTNPNMIEQTVIEVNEWLKKAL
jgi:dipeptidyl aminopeptidase/acylaminoacyl peptidase